MTDQLVRIAVIPPVPVASLRRELAEPAGDWTLGDVVDATGLPRESLGISIDGIVIPREEWAERKPLPGESVLIATRPGGVEIGATITSYVAAAAAAAGASTTVATIIGTVVAFVAVAGAMYGLSVLAASLLAPEQNSENGPKSGVRRTIAGSDNRFLPYEPVPQVLGRHRMFPPLAARSYTTVENGMLFQYSLMTFGYGTLALSDLRIGDEPLFKDTTALSYTGIMLADCDKWVIKRAASGLVTSSSVELELRQGTGADAAITIFNANIQEQVLGKRLRRFMVNEFDKTGKDDPVTHRTSDRAVRITVIISCPAGLIWRRDTGGVRERTVYLDIAYRSATSAGTWTDVERIKMTGTTMSSQFASRTWDVTEGTYDVRVTRRTEEGLDPGIIDITEWTSMLTHRAGDVVNVSGLCLVAMRARITGNFVGVVDQFNAIAQTVCLDWNGATWAAAATSNPASLFRHVLQGAANKRAVATAQLNLTKLQAWHTECASYGLQFNSVTQGGMTVSTVLRQIATAGRASMGIIDGLFTVVTENTLTGAPVQHFTARNVKSFVERRVLGDFPEAFKVQWVDPDSGWLDTERIVPADGFTETTATDFERLDLAGITDSDQAYLLGRYHLANLLLRPAEYVIETDFEHLDCTRGDWVKFAHDVILVGLAAGRVISATMSGTSCVGVVVDQECPMTVGAYAIRFRKSDGSTLLKVVTTASGNQTTLAFTVAITAGNPMPAAGDLFMFGVSGSESMDLIVKSIEPMGDLDAKVTLVDAASAVLSSTGTIPPYSPRITIPPSVNPKGLEKLRIIAVRTAQARARNTPGSSLSGIQLSIQPKTVMVTL